jgi:hypothetical protein
MFLAGLLCLLAGACAPSAFEARPVSQGFDAASGGVADPYGDGKQQLAAGRAGLAIERFRQALAQDRNSVDALNGLAVAYARLGRTPLAETYLQRALDLRHDDVATLNNYGRLLLEQGRWQEARLMLAMAERTASGPDNAVVQANLAAMQTPRPRRAAEPAPPLRLAKTDTATYRLETTTAVLPQVASVAPATTSAWPVVPTPAGPPVATITTTPAAGAARVASAAARPAAAAPASVAAQPNPLPKAPAPTTPATAVRAALAEPEPPVSGSLDPFIIVANGVGRIGLAAEWRGHLGRYGITVDSLANARPFQTGRTEIRFHPFFAREANALSALLPSSAALIADRNALGDIYVELGLDSLDTAGEPS